MKLVEKLGNKCTNTICHKSCPIWYFNHHGGGVECHNNCIEAMRFPTVANAVTLWLDGKPWDKQSLHKFGGDYD